MGGLDRAVKAVGAAAGIWIAGKALGAVKQFVIGTVTAASDLNESINAVNVAFGDNAEEINRIGENAATQLGVSQAEFNSHAVSLSAFVEQIAGETGNVVGTLEDLTGRATDFASVMNLEVGEALTTFRSGLAGESEPLRKYGIDVSAAKVEQVALAAGIVETGESMTEAQKVQARYLAIMQQTEKVTGDFANTSEGFANQQRILNSLWVDAQADIGQKLIPVFEKVQRALINLIPVITKVVGHMADLTASTLGLIDPLLALINVIPGLTSETDEATSSWNTFFTILKHVTAPLAVIGEQIGGLVDLITNGAPPTAEYTAEFEKMTEAMEGGVQTSKDWLKEQANFPAAFTGTEEELDNLVGTVQQYVVDAERGRFRSDEYAAALRDQGAAAIEAEGEQEDLNFEVRTGIDLMREAFDTVRAQTDATFGLKQAISEQEAAQHAVNAAIEEAGVGSLEHIEALGGLADANLDVRDAEIKLREEGALTRAEFVNQQIAMGLARQDAELLAAQYENLFRPRTVEHNIFFNEVTRTNPGRVSGRQHGGPVDPWTPYWVGEGGLPELFVPRVPGMIVPQSNVTTGGINANITVNLSGGATRQDAVMVGDEVERRLRRLAQARTAS